MADARHKRSYTKGSRQQMTPAWKQSVKDLLAQNEKDGKYPANQKELADAVAELLGKDVDKSAINRMFAASTSSYVDPICLILGLPPPMQATVSENGKRSETLHRIRNLDDADFELVERYIELLEQRRR